MLVKQIVHAKINITDLMINNQLITKIAPFYVIKEFIRMKQVKLLALVLINNTGKIMLVLHALAITFNVTKTDLHVNLHF